MSYRQSLGPPLKRLRSESTSSHKHEYGGYTGKDEYSDDEADRESNGQTREGYPDVKQGRSKRERSPRPLAVTCTHCRSRKIKCDNLKPSCTNCVKAGHECMYLAKQKPGLKAGTGETMLRRIESLEAEFERYRSTSSRRMDDLEAWRMHGGGGGGGSGGGSGSMPPMLMQQSGGMNSIYQNDQSQQYDQRNQLGLDNPDRTGMGDMGPPSSMHVGGMDQPSGVQLGIDPMFGYQPRNEGMNNEQIRGMSSGISPMTGLEPGTAQTSTRELPPLHLHQHHHQAPQNDRGYPDDTPIWTPEMILPRDDVVQDLISIYFDKIAPSTFILVPRDDQIWEPPWNIVVHGIVAVSLRFSQDDRVLAYRDQIHMAARRYVYLEAMEQLTFEALQALALLSIDVIGSGKGVEGWGCISLLTRSAVTADLLRETGMDNIEANNGQYTSGSGVPRFPSVLSKTSILQNPSSWREDEARRRLFWLIFALDRYTCTTTAIDTAIPAQDIRRRLPCADELWNGQDYHTADTFISPLNLYSRNSASLAALHPAAFFVEALDLMGRAHALQARSVDVQDPRAMETRRDASAAIVGAATRWYMDIQPAIGRFDDEGPISPLDLLTHGIYHSTILKLQSFHAYPALATNGSIVEPYATDCLKSARAITTLSCRATGSFDTTAPSVSPIFIWCCWIAARVFFVNSCLGAQINIEPEFKVILGSMKSMAAHWQLADDYVHLLLRAERKWHSLAVDMQNSPASGSLSEAVSVLLDLKKTGAQALRIGKYDVTPPEPARLADQGPFGELAPNWNRTTGGTMPSYGEVQNWFDTLELFASPGGFGPI